MLQLKEVKIQRILNPTAIDLGEYVINPFMGCEYSCLYCYVRSNRVVAKKSDPWGEYVDIRVNAPELLEKEILVKKPRTVLLGSTTECFQPIERKYKLTRKILEVLNQHRVYYTILTRSPYIIDYLALLKQGFCKKIYFTVNNFSADFKAVLEPKSTSFASREEAVNLLLDEGLAVVPYFSPILPWVSETKDVFLKFKKAKTIEFECLNFRINNIREIINTLIKLDINLKTPYEKLLTDRQFYAQTWNLIKEDIENQAKIAKKRYNIYTHEFNDYFNNKYQGRF